MKRDISGNIVICCLSLIVLFGSLVSASVSLQSSLSLPSNGLINYGPQVEITINSDKIIGANNLSLGFMLDWKWSALSWCDSPIQRELTQNAGFKLVRLFSHRIEPCTYWNESTKTGTFNWTDVNAIIQRIFEIGAEPLICLGFYYKGTPLIPLGMAIDSKTNLPYPESFGAYATEWVKHFKTLGWSVRYYEIMNEPYFYFGWNSSDTTKLANYVAFWNTVARSMRQMDPNIFISHDSSTIKWVFDYWLQHGDDIDFLDFHKYDAQTVGQFTDMEMFDRAERIYFETSCWNYGVKEARQRWLNARGKSLPIINSESNFNSAWINGTDPKIQQMAGAVWTALVLRTEILKGVSYNVYYSFFSSASWELANRPSGGLGFGMVNSDNNRPWYPYYVQMMLANNLGTGDLVVETNSSSDDLRSIAWIHNGTLNILLICKVEQPRTLYLQGVTGQLEFSKIDSTISFLTPRIQEGTFIATQPLIMNGYTVTLLQVS